MVNSSAVRRLAKRVRGASGRASMIAAQPSQPSLPLLPDATTSSPASASAASAATGGVGDTNGRTVAPEPSISSVPVSRSPSTMSKSASIETGVEKSNRSSNRSSNHSSETRLSSDVSPQSPRAGSSASADTNKRSRRLKSQYPRNANEKHVEYILVASFHIDRGPILENQYPGAIKGDQHMLAELMLPDQAHVRNQDWTIFFLHKDTSAEPHDKKGEQGSGLRVRKASNLQDGNTSPISSSTASRKSNEHTMDARSRSSNNTESDEGTETDHDEEAEGDLGGEPPLVYVLNLVNTKQDVTAKRGAVVKAMAICTRHSFLHIYKPLLLLALEEYFKAPHPDTLATLYNAVNAMDLSLMPRLSMLEGYILQATDAKDLFIEKFALMIQQRMEEEEGENGENTDSPPSPNRTSDDTSKRGTGNQQLSLPRDTHEFESKVIYNGIRIPIKVPTALYPETVGGFSLIKLIQVFSAPHAKDPQPFMLHAHLTTSGPFTHPIIVLVNAMLTQKRVIFLGHNRPSGEVAEAVLAACALASGGVLRGFTRHAFPYTDLSKIDDLLKVLGFIAGVTNPAFAHHPEWWDLLCDITTGRMKISHRIEPAPVTEGYVNFQQQSQINASSSGTALPPAGGSSSGDPTGDQAFMENILRSIVSRHGESVIRAKWRDWIVKFTRIAAAFEESVYGASALCISGEEGLAEKAGIIGHGYVWSDETSRQRELGGNVFRIEGWRNTRSYYRFIQDLARQYSMRPVKSLDLHHLLDRLRTQKLSAADAAAIYLALASSINTYDEICQLLTATPESHAGLFYVSMGLFHPWPDVRRATWHLLDRIREHMAGRHFWNSLNQFIKLAFFRQQRQMMEGAAQQQQQQQAQQPASAAQTPDGGSKERGNSG